MEATEGASKYNTAEVEVVVGVVNQLLAGGLAREEIGVITPYGAQVAAYSCNPY